MKKVLLPSLLSADFSRLDREVEEIESAGVDHLHLDIMDGHYVPNISFGPGLIQKLRPRTDLFFDAHLMVEEPDPFLEDFQKAGCDLVTVHLEASTHIHRTLQAIHALGMKAGLALNPGTSTEGLSYLMDELDLILVMSVNPGFGGQSFIPSALEKIKDIRQKIDRSGREIILEVDGGIKKENVEEVIRAGADWLVAGSAVFSPGKTESNAKELLEIISRY
ncbi:MAG: ribulose-phosphate 3-epimerase [Firmicutes bacterium]|nr:ribulose-phosphate 3-epimerase [Bacillota bacterium]